MEKLAFPSRSLVIVCGPSCAGKTTLSQHILKAAPSTLRKWHCSTDDEFVDAMARIPELKQLHREIIGGRIFSMQEVPERLRKQMSIMLLQQIREHCDVCELAVMDGLFLRREALQSVLMTLRRFCDDRPFVVARVAPDESLHHEFYLERRKRGMKISEHYILQQRKMFEGVVNADFTQGFFGAYRQYTVTDPREVEICFF